MDEAEEMSPVLPAGAAISEVAQKSTRQLRKRYALALVLISLLAVASQMIMLLMISAQTYDSRIVNISGRQRMLSQKLAKTSMYIAAAGSRADAEPFLLQLSETLSLWQRAHVALQNGDEQMQLPGQNSAVVTALFRGLEPLELAMADAAAQILKHPDDAAVIAAAVQIIRQNEPAYLVRMDQIASQFDSEAKERVLFARWLSLSLAAVLLLALALQALFVFAPANRRLRENLRLIVEREKELERQRQDLEALVEQRTRQLEERARISEMATAEVSELQQRLSYVFVATAHGLLLADAEGLILMVNPAMEELFGYTHGELDGQRVETLLPEAKRQQHIGVRTEFVQGSGSKAHPTRVLYARHKSGALVPIDLTLQRWQSAQETLVLASVIDLTERQRYEAELLRASMLAKEASRSKSQFLANMSHEIRTPMNAILGFASLIRRDGVPALQMERLDKIDSSTQHLLGIINDILDLSKIEAGKLFLEQTSVSIETIVTNVASMLHDRAQAKGISLQVEVATQSHRYLGDSTRLQQALLNYAANAVKFTESGGVTLRVSLEDDAEESALLRFQVDDSGIGIPEEALGRLFHVFEQADNSTTRKHGGTGLGLSITKQLAQLMGGEAGVDSEPGVGSSFWFTARLRKDGAATEPIPKARATDIESRLAQICLGRRILVVDDDALNREVAQSLLQDIGVAIDTANDGREAVNMVARHPYALILMDMQMPEMDGVAATLAIRAQAGSAGIPILAMTANAFSEDRALCLAAGMNDFISKPFSPELLFAIMLQWLGSPSEAASSPQALSLSVTEAPAGLPATPLLDMSEELQAVVTQLSALLADNDTAARKLLQVQGPLLQQALGPSVFAKLERQLAAFNFSAATALLETLQGKSDQG